MGVFSDMGEGPERAASGRDLMDKLALPFPRLLCSLIHKFGRRTVDDFAEYIRRLEDAPPPISGELFIFVDECHRTQGGKMHRAMKAVMPNAVLIGFTGTPLLKTDSATTREVFGRYIHTYKFNEAVKDKVVLDLLYEARDIEQQLGPAEEIDAWFDAKTRGLNSWQRDALRERWGTMQTVLSSRNRMDRVVADLVFDFSTKPRLNDGRGNAILVASSIYEACKYFELFAKTPLRDCCAVVTSFEPQGQNASTEDTGANSPTDKQFILDTYRTLLRDVTPVQRKSKAETYEDAAKLQFKDEPERMKLLIVVDKLLTGFDAPGCTYLYIDKENAQPRAVPGDLPHQPARRRFQRFRAHRRLQAALPERCRSAAGLHGRAGRANAGHRRFGDPDADAAGKRPQAVGREHGTDCSLD